MPQEQEQSTALLSSPVRRDILDTLVNLPTSATESEPFSRDLGLTAAELATRLGRHVTTIRFHVDQLLKGGLVTASDQRGEVGRPRRHYAVSKGAVPVATSDEGYRLLAELFAQAMADGVHSAEDAGRHWVKHNADKILPSCPSTKPASTVGMWLAKMGVVVDVLHGWGYASSLRTCDQGQTAEMAFTECPFRELARRNPSVACSIHRGLVQGTLELLGEAGADLKVVPFVEPDLCTARITTKTEFSPQGGTDDRH